MAEAAAILAATPTAARVAELEAALAAAEARLRAVERYASGRAIGARARGDDEEERRWLDLLINATPPQPAP
jgi:hypothetical protein